MLNVELKYNPYFVTTELTLDGKSVAKDSKLGILTADRLQNWIDRFFPELYNHTRETQIRLHFIGTVRDYSDVYSAVESYMALNPKCHIDLESTLSSETDESRIKRLKALFEDGKHGPFRDDFNSSEMQQAFQRAIDPTFEINVIATMSSGKSTLINALLGKELVPAKNEACTATIARISDDSTKANFTAQRFGSHGEVLSAEVEATKKLISDWNEDSKTYRIEIGGNIPTVKQTEACSMVFVDTPGPNHSYYVNHQRITMDTIQNKPLSMVIYVLNATQLSTNDDCSLLRQVHQAMSAGGRRAHDRFIFVVNKIDEFDPEKGESVKSALENARSYLKKNGIEKPLVIPASAELAKLIRLKRQGAPLTRSETCKLANYIELFIQEPEMNMLDHTRSRLNSECVRRLEQRLDTAKEKQNKEAVAEVLSGVPIVEELLNDFLEKHATPARLKDAVDSFNAILQKSKLAEKINEQLQRSQEELVQINAQIESFINDKQYAEEAKKYRDEINAMEYKPSEESLQICEDINTQSEKIIEELQMKIQETSEFSEKEAEQMLEYFVGRCIDLENEINMKLSTALGQELCGVIAKWQQGYQEHVEKVLNERFPNSPATRELQIASIDMPSIEDVLEYHTVTNQIEIGTEKVQIGTRQVKVGEEKIKVGVEREKIGEEDFHIGYHYENDSKWWNPLSWGRKKLVNDYGKRDVFTIKDIIEVKDIFEEKPVYEEKTVYGTKTIIRMKPIVVSLVKTIRKYSMSNREEFKKQAKENVENIKNTLLQLMEKINDRILEIHQQMLDAQNNQEKKEKLVEENQEKVDWCRQFCEKLQNILDI